MDEIKNHKYTISRSFAPIFMDIMELIGFDVNLYFGDRNYYEDDIIKVVPYSETFMCAYYDDKGVPSFYDGINFRHKPSGLEIAWYKYPFRSATSNKAMTYREFVEMMSQIALNYNVSKKEIIRNHT